MKHKTALWIIISIFLTTTQLTFNKTCFAAAPAESPALIEKGKTSYKMNCVICHGDKGDGNGPAGAGLKPKPRNFMTDAFKGADGKGQIAKPSNDQIYAVLQSGVKGTSMAPFAHLPEDQKWGLVFYIQQLRKEKK